MEEKKFDLNSLIGMVLLGALAFFWIYNNKPTEEELAKQKAERIQDSIQKVQLQNKSNTVTSQPTEVTAINPTDSTALANAQTQLGAFAFSATLPSAKANTTTIENELVKISIDNKGGQVSEVELKNFKTWRKTPLYLVKDANAEFNINFGTTDNRTLNTKDLFFEPILSKNGENTVLTMRLKASNDKYLEYSYELKPNDYMLDFAVRSQGLSNIINSSQAVNLDWRVNAFRNEKSAYAEDMYTWFYFKRNGEDVSYLNKDEVNTEASLNWVAFKQHFFTSILKSDTPFEKAEIESRNLVVNEKVDTVNHRKFALKTPLTMKGGELNYNMNLYYGPSDYKTLKQYENTDLDETADLGWGIFGVINRTIFIPIFSVLSSFISNYGLLIIVMTIVVRIFMSPLVYKSYLSSARMKVLRPEMDALNKKYPGQENAMKRQQEVMALQRKAGVSPLAGCIPALLQMPIFFALFKFFPTNIELRQKNFLWANDLSSYDTIFKLPFNIPFYGDHVSLFPILAAIAIFFYMRMTQSQQANMQPPTQEGMPDMGKLMKMMLYISPVMMLIFFNKYASGLSLYYFISNLLTIAIMLIIKNFVIDEKKIHAEIQENRAKPEKKKSKFRQRLDEAMKQAQEQQEIQKRGRKK